MLLVSKTEKKVMWQTVIVATLAFWLSGTLILDTIFMPTLYASGMMAEPGFVTAAYAIFWVFNRIELMCAALILTSSLILLFSQQPERWSRRSVFLSLPLLVLTLIYTYGLTPQMSALGLQLNLFNPSSEAPALMNVLHASYWVLEIAKLALGGVLLKLYYRSPAESLALKGS